MYKILKIYWPLLLLSALNILLRIYKIEQLFYFTYDESVPAFVGRRLILWHHIPLIGGVTPFGFHLPPYFYWFLALLLKIGNLNPISWGYASAILATFTTFLIFVVGKEFSNKKTAFIAASIWTFSYLANLFDRRLWALYWGPAVSLLTILALNKIIKGEKKYYLLLGLTFVVGFTTDPSNLIFVGSALVAFLIYRVNLKYLAFPIILLIASALPLVAFDLRHNFANLRPLLSYSHQANIASYSRAKIASDNLLMFPKTATRLIYAFGDKEVSMQYSYCLNYIREKFNAVPIVLTIFSLLLLIHFLFIHIQKKDKTWNLIAVVILLYVFAIQIFGTLFKSDVFEHYISGLLPLFALIAAKYLTTLPRKAWLTLLAIFIAINLYKLSLTKNGLGLETKKQAIAFTMSNVGSNPFSLDSLSTCWKYSGYRYLFAVFGKEPVKSYVDPNFSYLYGTTQVWGNHPDTVVIFVVHDFAPETADFYKNYALYKGHERTSALFGNIEVIIMENYQKWFR